MLPVQATALQHHSLTKFHQASIQLIIPLAVSPVLGLLQASESLTAAGTAAGKQPLGAAILTPLLHALRSCGGLDYGYKERLNITAGGETAAVEPDSRLQEPCCCGRARIPGAVAVIHDENYSR